MNTILQLKTINSIEKLILLHIFEYVAMNLPYQFTSSEIAEYHNVSKKQIHESLWVLEELGYIKSTVEYRYRKTEITPLLNQILENL